MRLFARISFICNLSFLLFMLLRYLELGHRKGDPAYTLLPLPFITGLVVILGQLAIFVNLAFCFVVIVLLFLKRLGPVPQWLVIANFIFLLLQIFFFI